MEIQRDKPMRKRCDCGSEVKNHHWLCDKCWGKKARKKYHEERKSIYKQLRKAAKKGNKKLKLEQQNKNVT